MTISLGFNPTDLNDLRVSEGSSLQGSAEERVEEYSTANLTGMWKVNSEETPCYVHHVKYANEDNKVEDNSLWWIGASKEGGDMPWMVVYNGTIDNEKNEIDGKWAAIPITIANGKHARWVPLCKEIMDHQDHTKCHGKLRLKIISQTNERRISLVRMSERYVGENGGFGNGLTGTWRANDGGTYYLHHVKYANEDNKVEDNSLWWIGASKEGGDMPWMVVYNGTIDNEKNEIDGKWAAIPITIANGKWAPQPKGTMHGRGLGKLRLKIISQTNERRISLVRMSERYVGENGGFGGSAWEMIGQYPDMD